MGAERIAPLRLVAAAVLALAGLAAADAVLVLRTFDDDTVDMPPAGFAFSMARQREPGVWAVRGWGPQHHLEHLADAAAAKGLSLAVVGPAIKDVQVSVKVQLVNGERVGGLVWRYQDGNNFYGVAIDLQHPEVALFRVVGGNRIRLDHVTEIDLDHDLSHSLLIRHQADEIRVQLDGIGVLRVRDRGLPNAGRAGVWSGGAARTWFNDLRIEEVTERRW
jgi:hypothetical protein